MTIQQPRFDPDRPALNDARRHLQQKSDVLGRLTENPDIFAEAAHALHDLDRERFVEALDRAGVPDPRDFGICMTVVFELERTITVTETVRHCYWVKDGSDTIQFSDDPDSTLLLNTVDPHVAEQMLETLIRLGLVKCEERQVRRSHELHVVKLMCS